jgi:hypothetical protein
MEDIGCAHDPNVLKIRGMAGANGLLEEGGQITVTRGSCRKGRETRGESAPPLCAMGQMHWCGAPPAMKVGEPATHMYLAPALARRALTVEEKRGEERMVWRKALSLFFMELSRRWMFGCCRCGHCTRSQWLVHNDQVP